MNVKSHRYKNIDIFILIGGVVIYKAAFIAETML